MPKSPNIYLGIDPGSTLIGYGVLEDAGNGFKPLHWGVIRNPGTDQSADKQATYDAIRDLVKTWKPTAAGVERLFFFNNQKTAMAVSEMRGVIVLALADHGVPLREFTPLQVKQRVCGHGKAEKKQVQTMVRMLLKIKEQIKPDDAADALALAICCATMAR